MNHQVSKYGICFLVYLILQGTCVNKDDIMCAIDLKRKYNIVYIHLFINKYDVKNHIWTEFDRNMKFIE